MKKSTTQWVISLVVITCILLGGCKKKPKEEALPPDLSPTVAAEAPNANPVPTVKAKKPAPTQQPAAVKETRSFAKKLNDVAGVWFTISSDGTVYRLEIRTEKTYKLSVKQADGSYKVFSSGKAKFLKNHIAMIPPSKDTCNGTGAYKIAIFHVNGTITKLVFHKLKDTCKERSEIVRGEWFSNLP